MITAKNYTGQAEKALLDSDVEKEIVETILNIIKNAQHFAAPDGGAILNDRIKGLVGVKLNLPFDYVTLEYCTPLADATKNVIFASQDAKFIYLTTACYFHKYKKWQFSKCTITVKRNAECRDEGIKYDVKFPKYFNGHYTEERLRSEEMNNKSLSFSIFELIEALSCKNVYTKSLETIDPEKNKQRAKKGKVAIYETKILVVDTAPKEIDTEWKGGTHASPKQHLRRGHIRRYSWGNIWINNQVIGKVSNGKVDKSYEILGG